MSSGSTAFRDPPLFRQTVLPSATARIDHMSFALSGKQPQTFSIFSIGFYRRYTGITSFFYQSTLPWRRNGTKCCHIVASVSNNVTFIFYIIYNPSIYSNCILTATVLIWRNSPSWQTWTGNGTTESWSFLSRQHFWNVSQWYFLSRPYMELEEELVWGSQPVFELRHVVHDDSTVWRFSADVTDGPKQELNMFQRTKFFSLKLMVSSKVKLQKQSE